MANPTDEEIEADPVRRLARHGVRCRHLGLNPDETTPERLREVMDESDWRRDCKLAGLDPATATKAEVAAAVKRIAHDCAGFAATASYVD
jgi:hypothetical protein